MKYKKAQEVLPVDLINALQEFVEGEYIYIPKRYNNKKAWGHNTGIKIDLNNRNKKIYEDFNNGRSIKQLSEKYYLVENSIRRIIRECRKGT